MMNSGNVMVGEGIKFERIRRVTGYLVGTLDRFNNAKKAEERDRIKHGIRSCVDANNSYTNNEQKISVA